MSSNTNDNIGDCTHCNVTINSIEDSYTCNNCNKLICNECRVYQDDEILCEDCATRCHNRSCRCIPSETHMCADCGNSFCSDCVAYNDYTDQELCEQCEREAIEREERELAEEEREHDYDSYSEYSVDPQVVPYHSMQNLPLTYSKTNAESRYTRYLGIELELWDNGNDHEKILKIPQDHGLKNLYHFELDGSVDLEFITNPCTLNFHKKKIAWKKLLKSFSDKGFTSYNSDDEECKSAGLHVHVSRQRNDVNLGYNLLNNCQNLEEKLYGFFTVNKTVLNNFGKRKSNYSRNYAKIISKNDLNNLKPNYIGMKYREIGKYCSVNVKRNTIEFRLFQGTLNYKRFIASLEFCDAIVLFCETHSYLTCINRRNSWLAFYNFLVEQKKYNNLLSYLLNNDLGGHITLGYESTPNIETFIFNQNKKLIRNKDISI